jgi:hypothetical protein
VRKEQDERQQPSNTHDRSAAAEPRRRPFAEPVLVKHDRVTRIHLISDAFEASGGSGGTFF